MGISKLAATTMGTVTLLMFVAIVKLADGGPVVHEYAASALQTVKQWNLLTYNFLPRMPFKNESFYNPYNVIATSIAVFGERIFIATPQLFSGVPATVSFMSKAAWGDSPVLQAFPDWSFSTAGRANVNCSEMVLISVYRLRIDSCNRLWVLDAGVQRSFEDFNRTCPPKILIFDLATNLVVRRIDFPTSVMRGESLFTNLIIDDSSLAPGTGCDDVFVYITDTVEPAIIVYDSKSDLTWRLSHPAMYPDPDFSETEILNDRFILMDGIVGFAFDKQSGRVYFQPLATDRIFSVAKEALRAGPIDLNQVLPVQLVGRKSSQGITLTFAPSDNSLVFSPMTETAIASWHPRTHEQTILARDSERLQFVADMTTSAQEPDAIYAISSKFHRNFLKTLNAREINTRILRISLANNRSDGSHSGGFADSATPSLVPFNTLHSGEAFPLRKEHRNTNQKSFLDRLTQPAGPAYPSVALGAYQLQPSLTLGSGYFYAQHF